jgi:hypothetical protein
MKHGKRSLYTQARHELQLHCVNVKQQRFPLVNAEFTKVRGFVDDKNDEKRNLRRSQRRGRVKKIRVRSGPIRRNT